MDPVIVTLDSMTVPEGSCPGTGNHPLPASKGEDDEEPPRTGVCPACQGRFRLGSDSRLPNHSPARPKAGG
jgi:hypothetical protein